MEMQMNELLRELCLSPGIAEGERAPDALAALGPVTRTPAGSFFCTVCPPKDGGPHILLDAHLDEIGLIVTQVTDEGFIRAAACGGIDRRLLPASAVTIHAEEPVPAVVCSVPPHIQKGDTGKAMKADAILLDAGLDPAHARERVRPGDRVTFDAPFDALLGGNVTCKALDDRAGCAAVLRAGELLAENKPACGVSVALTSLEETGGPGAGTAAYALCPTHAIVVDVSFARCEGAPKHVTATLGSGAMIGIAPILDRRMSDGLRACAEKHGIAYTMEVMGGSTGTNADAIAASRAGVRTGMVSIPQKNMHTPVEIVCPDDVEAAAQLIAAYVRDTFSEEAGK